jgi:hypothetical protein
VIIYRRCSSVSDNGDEHLLQNHNREHLEKNHYMSVNSKPTASQQNMKKLPISTIFSFISGVVDTGD